MTTDLCVYRFVGTLDISLGLLRNGRYQSPPLSLKNKEGESLEVTIAHSSMCVHNGVGIQFEAEYALTLLSCSLIITRFNTIIAAAMLIVQ